MSRLNFPPQSVEFLAAALGLKSALPELAHALSDDSREITPGMIFIARRGVAHSAQAYIQAALDAGAVWVISDEAYANDRVTVVADSAAALMALVEVATGQSVAELHIIGITGTNGKTSVAQFIASTLAASGAPHTEKVGLIGTLG
ncbi:MAG: hypothetical protein B7Y53_01595, partial [Halothiobacillus sp. 28-55-5]